MPSAPLKPSAGGGAYSDGKVANQRLGGEIAHAAVFADARRFQTQDLTRAEGYTYAVWDFVPSRNIWSLDRT
jgi:hypothetical protein